MVPLERTPLGRLRADEAYMARRLANISNFGATWLKPPGVAKSLYQMREERREAEEHAEAVRREQLAAELAEAEAAQAAQGAEGLEGGMMDVEEGEGEGTGEVDLDDEIPDADASGMGGFDYDEDSSEEEEQEEEEEDVDHGENEDDDEDDVDVLAAQQRRAQQRELATREDRLRELMARGGNDAEEADMYGVAGEELDDEAQGEILEEEDLVHEHNHHLQYDVEPGEDLDMDANLDDDIPEAESLGGYEHTDSDAELSSSEDDGGPRNVSFGAGRGGRAPQTAARYRSSLASNATRQSLDISSILDSSMMGSSPQVRRRN
ncbi:hypothetical protein CONLIGDRAFT_430059 [Coniochaeta ligniaria NRRL 30616]|uniref:Apc15p protein-domain-containing protein n=1 Tax=Coniochaeta ligniaria NRRL 30616 TaxID=1408157 RepID=A0A1J7IIZ4_9PEZI|nr:hypothetical protein CONLIGDRAFT_430059 [Coniochaeta ligniaria NRRL 30616]